MLVDCGVPWLIDAMNVDVAENVIAAQFAIQTILNTLAGFSKEGKPDKNMIEGEIFFSLVNYFQARHVWAVQKYVTLYLISPPIRYIVYPSYKYR